MRPGLALATTVLIAALAHAQEPPARPPLSLAEAVRRGTGSRPAVASARARVAQAEAHLRGAGAPLNPTVTVQHGVGANTGGLDEDLVVQQTIELGGKRGARVATAAAELRQARAELEVTRQRIAFEVRQAYQQVLVEQGELELARQAERLAEQFATTAAAQFQAGEVPRTEVVRSELELETERRNVADALASLEQGWTTLDSLIGSPTNERYSLTDALTVAPISLDAEALRKRALERPELVAARAQVEAREAAVRTARRAATPDFFAAGTVGNFQTGGVSARAGLTFPLIDRGSLRAARREAEAAVVQGNADLAETRRTLELEIELARQRAEQARAAMQGIETRQLPRARELLTMAQEAYRQGLGSFLELLDAQRAFNSTSAALLRARAAYALALAEVQRVVGAPLSPETSQ